MRPLHERNSHLRIRFLLLLGWKLGSTGNEAENVCEGSGESLIVFTMV